MVRTIPHDEKRTELCRISVHIFPAPLHTPHSPKYVSQKKVSRSENKFSLHIIA